MKMSIPRLRSQIEKLEEETTRLQEKLRELLSRLQEEGRLGQQLAARVRHGRSQFLRDAEETQALVEDLRRELLHQQQLRRSDRGGGGGGAGRSPREGELEGEVRRLKQENVKLKESNEELGGQLVALGLHEAQGLLTAAAKSQSLGAEIESASRGQLMDALKELEGINFHLRQYMDKIILAIIDHSPSILEIRP
ncbi:rab11 family-interacting protein 4B-like [Lethenteron reissneri]|uniref:rab11 family-interacting protein 4B-like n=1 Tax=Lethenteron reissneri TaxID=7753 RepID=UPI002AB667BA|nr:rab11 family-interacting protein 4B-like [Lethenteron reissneri]